MSLLQLLSLNLQLYIFFALGIASAIKFLRLCRFLRLFLDDQLKKLKMPAQLQAFPLFNPICPEIPVILQAFTLGWSSLV
ncbi:hypothetical protein BC351_14215 [Paenibacillus ferrarius]|uniref:Uncharacterized protein n=1 Tax=Paenibacillus ferrarius TaxID=1469647 RepID=A0A1V4H6Z5_9BACL|nr:hypothetical protein BC351_14215 [Paenibacillus ferrarius]